MIKHINKLKHLIEFERKLQYKQFLIKVSY